ncbi:MAG: DUF192 domain-containing protein [Candidatus Binatia bacterium]
MSVVGRAGRLLGVAGTLAVALLACGPSAPVAIVRTTAGTVEVALEVAATDEARARGLMYRTDLADGHGMLFVFPTAAVHDFWMKNTLIPLDMIWIGADRRIVGIRAATTPLSTTPIGIGAPALYVLEVPGGFAARHGIAPGNEIVLRGVPTS